MNTTMELIRIIEEKILIAKELEKVISDLEKKG